MKGMMDRQDGLDDRRKSDITRLESQVVDKQREIEQLNMENHKLEAEISAGKERRRRHRSSHTSEHIHPITCKEEHTLAVGVANKLLNELRRDMARTQQENADLGQQLIK